MMPQPLKRREKALFVLALVMDVARYSIKELANRPIHRLHAAIGQHLDDMASFPNLDEALFEIVEDSEKQSETARGST